jgi:hypothetical protein
VSLTACRPKRRRLVALCLKSDSSCQLPAPLSQVRGSRILVALRAQLVQPFARAGGFSFTPLLDDVLGCPAGAVACPFVRRRLNGAQFFRPQRSEVEPGELNPLLDRRPKTRQRLRRVSAIAAALSVASAVGFFVGRWAVSIARCGGHVDLECGASADGSCVDRIGGALRSRVLVRWGKSSRWGGSRAVSLL